MVGKDIDVLVGVGIAENQAEFQLSLLHETPELFQLFVKSIHGQGGLEKSSGRTSDADG
jgi:hypothetical protein